MAITAARVGGEQGRRQLEMKPDEARDHGEGEGMLEWGLGDLIWGTKGGRARVLGQAEVFGLSLAGEP